MFGTLYNFTVDFSYSCLGWVINGRCHRSVVYGPELRRPRRWHVRQPKRHLQPKPMSSPFNYPAYSC